MAGNMLFDTSQDQSQTGGPQMVANAITMRGAKGKLDWWTLQLDQVCSCGEYAWVKASLQQSACRSWSDVSTPILPQAESL